LLQVSSNYGSDGAGYIVRYNGTISVGSYVVRYKVFQVYHARSDPSVCEVFFVVENEQVNANFEYLLYSRKYFLKSKCTGN